MRTIVVLMLAALICAAPAVASRTQDQGRLRPPVQLKNDDKVIWMSEWVACRHSSLHHLASELGLKVPPGRTPQVTAKIIAKIAEEPLWNLETEYVVAVDGCRNGILWRFYHE
jgi:hypothetical protein